MLNYYFLLGFLMLGSLGYSAAYAHTSVNVEQYVIEIGWNVEPPVVGFRNAIVYEINESHSEGVKMGLTNAFKNLQSTIRMGGLTKILDIDSKPKPGHYFSKIIPTKIGTLIIELKGEINGVPVDIEIPIEDVETTAILDFPLASGPSSGQEVATLKNSMSYLQKEVIKVKSKIDGIDSSGGETTSNAYNFGVFGLSLGAAGIILAIIAMTKRK